MFKLLEARDLFYKEKSLDDFDIDSEDSPFKSFYEILLTLDGTRIEDPDVEGIITDMFNDACYICTIALLVRRPALKIGVFRQYCVTDKTRHYSFATEDARADEVLCMVFYLLMNCKTNTSETDQFVFVLNKHLKEHSNHSYETYDSFFDKCKDFFYIFPAGEFNQRVLAFDEFDWAGSEPDWKSITNHYNKKDIKEIIECWKDPQQRDIVIDDIVSEISSNYYYEGSGYKLPIIWPGKTQEEMIDFVESLRLTDRCLKKIIEEEKMADDKVIILYLPKLHESLAGIVAGRIKEKYYRPTLVFTDSEDTIKASGRSIEAYNMYDELNKCADLYTKFGGHAMAAGLSMPKENLNEFRDRIAANCSLTDEDLIRKILIDVPMPLSYVTEELIGQLSLLEPFGTGNPSPVFADKSLEIISVKEMGKTGDMCRMRVRDIQGKLYDLVMFSGYMALRDEVIKAKGVFDPVGVSMDIIYYPDINEYNGRRSIQYQVKDFNLHC